MKQIEGKSAVRKRVNELYWSHTQYKNEYVVYIK
jgi:hypothetical protein